MKKAEKGAQAGHVHIIGLIVFVLVVVGALYMAGLVSRIPVLERALAKSEQRIEGIEKRLDELELKENVAKLKSGS